MSADPERPSARAVERLATGVGADVDDLRTRLHRALDEADRLQAEGRGDLAVSVLEEQRDALLVVHQRLEARLAEAAVEREAERVVHGAAPVVAPPGVAPASAAVAGDDSMTLRLVASAVAAVLGVALLLSPELSAGELTAAGSSAAGDALEEDASGAAAEVHDAAAASTTADRRTGAATEASGATDLRPLAYSEAGAASSRARDGNDDDADPTDDGERVPLPDVGPTLDALTGATPEVLADDEEDGEDTAGADGDDGSTTGSGEDAAGQDRDDTSQDEPAQDDDTTAPSQDAATDDDGGTDGGADVDGSTSGDQAGSGADKDASDADGEEPASGGVDLDGSSSEPLSLER